MKKHNPPPNHFPYQRPVRVRRHFEQISYKLKSMKEPFGLLEEVPSIKLEGDWLQEAGFHCKTEGMVTVKDGYLVIKPD